MHPPSTSQESPKYLPLSDPFLPLYLIIYTSIQTCYFSQEEKQTRTKLKHSLLTPTCPSRYCPISLLYFYRKTPIPYPSFSSKDEDFYPHFPQFIMSSFLFETFYLFLRHHYFSWLCAYLAEYSSSVSSAESYHLHHI